MGFLPWDPVLMGLEYEAADTNGTCDLKSVLNKKAYLK